MEIWTIYILPVIQFLIGPIVVGVVVFRLTNKAAIKRDKEKMIRQLNVHYFKLERIIQLVENISDELDRLEDCERKISQMKNGDYSSPKEELESIGNESDYLQMFVRIKASTLKSVSKLRNQITTAFSELDKIPNDLLPPNIHADVIEIIESKQVELDLIKHKRLLKSIKKAM